ncbi:MAG TPA: spermidine synthase [Methylomirabilota bacterium]|nr:spermidine synthase [Methylomirabilota bacterium]
MQIGYEEVDREVTALGELVLRQYRAETGETGYEILLDGAFLMASHGSHAERAMAGLAHRRLPAGASDLSVLVGGLGAGHTLRAALDLENVARVVVAEIGARVVDWNRRYFADANGGAVDDPRVGIVIDDLVRVIGARPGAFDLMLLDVDNGPGWIAAPGNARLYTSEGLEACRRALRPGGVLAIWSPGPNPTFETALREVFPAVDTETTTAPDEPSSTIYVATA